MNKSNIHKPNIQASLAEVTDLLEYWESLERDYPVVNIHAANLEASNSDFNRLELSGSRIERGQFLDSDFDHASFVDMVFDHCDFSNSKFEEVYFQRCEFVNCRFLGCQMTDCVLRNCFFKESTFEYANLNGAYFESVEMETCNMAEAFLGSVRYKSWKAVGTRFVHTNFFKTRLKGFDFSKCELSDIIISDTMEEIKGAKISAVQALEIARLAGVIVQ